MRYYRSRCACTCRSCREQEPEREARSLKEISENGSLIQATRYGVLSRMQKLLEEDDVDVNTQYSKGWMILEDVDAGTPYYGWNGMAALHVCSKLEEAQMLIENGADLNLRNEDGKTPLHFHCKEGRLGIIRLLIENGAGLNVQDKNGFTPLQEEVIKWTKGEMRQEWILKCREKVVKLLVESGADLNTKDKNNERTPLHHACDCRHLEIAKLLIQNGAAVNDKDKYGTTPLLLACFNAHFEMIKLLIDNGADPITRNKSGKTPLDFAAEGNHADIVWLLVRQNPLLLEGIRGMSERPVIAKANIGPLDKVIKQLLSRAQGSKSSHGGAKSVED